jgi:acyl carrier protein
MDDRLLVQRILRRHLQAQADVPDDLSDVDFAELGLTSLALVALIIDIQAELGVVFSSDTLVASNFCNLEATLATVQAARASRRVG